MWSLTEPQGLKVFQVKFVSANSLREDLRIHALCSWCQMTDKTQTTIHIYIYMHNHILYICITYQCLFTVIYCIVYLWLFLYCKYITDILVCSSVHGQSSRRMYFLFIYCIFISTQSVGISINFVRRKRSQPLVINPHFHNPAVQILSLKVSRPAAPQRWDLSSVMQSEPNLTHPDGPMGKRLRI